MALFKYTIIYLSALLFLMPGLSYSWFSHTDDKNCQGFSTNFSVPDNLSNTYGLHYNREEGCKDPGISLGSGNNALVFADRVNIDIPLSILSKEAIDPEESLDRLLAANLRLQNILDEYLAYKKRSELLLKDLRIPYLEKQKNRVKPQSAMAGEVREGEKLKKDIENIIRHGPGFNSLNPEQAEQSVAAIHNIKQAGTGGNPILLQGNGDARGQITKIAGYQQLPGVNVGRQYDNELPWIFRFLLGIFNYALNNKLEISTWSGVGLISMLIVTLVIKR
ncbi:MAG: hypothetical protein PF503_14575 [Desulfobacula sp.]|jgi:hypothetical protein|nr:hypothetical protein [Desulfobacula sp.]